MTPKNVAFWAFVLFATLLGLNFAFGLVSSASDIGVVVGVLIIIGIIAAYVPTVRKLWKRATEAANSLGIIAVIVIGAAMFSSGCGYTRVEPGHVGIKVHLYGGDKGVDFEPVKVGAYWYNPWYTTIYEYPTYVQTAKWTQAIEEGSPTNEEISFNTKEGMVITVDISLSYHLDGERVPAFFAKFRTDKLDTFTHGFMRNIARDAFNDLGPNYTVEEVYGEKKEDLRKAAFGRVQEQIKDFGVILEQFGYIGAMRLPEKVVEALNLKIQATQVALQIQNEVAQAQATAKKKVAEAEGEAQARLTNAKATAESNRMIAQSLTPELVQWLLTQKWDGRRPMVEGSGSGLLLSLDTALQEQSKQK